MSDDLPEDLKEIERSLFFAVQQKAIGRLLAADDGGTFTTQQYRESMGVVLTRPKEDRTPRMPPKEIAVKQLIACPTVVRLGEDHWMTTDSREP